MASTWKKDEPKKLCARDLKSGTVVRIGGKTLKVKSVMSMDGSDGGRPTLIAEHGPTAVALKIEFESVICHPGEVFD